MNSRKLPAFARLSLGWKLRWVAFLLGVVCFWTSSLQAKQQIRIAYLELKEKPKPALSNLDPPIPKEGVQGAEQGLLDNNGTGKFLGQEFLLKMVAVEPGGDLKTPLRSLLAEDYRFILVRTPANQQLELAQLPEAQQALFFNVSATDDRLRTTDCRSNLLHMTPSAAMKADALAQFLISKRWNEWFLVVGQTPEDELYAAALRRAAKRFGGKIVEEKRWDYGPDARRTAQSEVPVFTQGVDYDVLLVADVEGLFGEYLIYRTWEPKIIAGTQGLVPTSWHRTHEQWGAVQLRSRFLKNFNRYMSPLDYSVWAAVRAIGEGATRTKSDQFDDIRSYLLGEEFSLAAFKGVPLSFRNWNGQLRQPILLAAARSLVSVSPQQQFLHQFSQMDTLGFDRPEVSCSF